MNTFQTILYFQICIAGAAFFVSFASTFGSGKFCSIAAAIFYSIGMMTRMSPYAYFHFFRGSNWTLGRYPILEWLTPILFLCFGIAAVVLLLPSIPQKTAIRLGIILFLVICPILVLLRMLPQFLLVHYRASFDLGTWILYAVLWFRVREGYERVKPANFPQAS